MGRDEVQQPFGVVFRIRKMLFPVTSGSLSLCLSGTPDNQKVSHCFFYK